MHENYLTKLRQEVDAHMLKLVEAEAIPDQLKQSMTYSIEMGGKRLRPILLCSVLKALDQEVEKGYQVAAALEMIHTYSLIHDDLPAMDDDDLRRGQPSNHIVFGEATAILAGDGLLTHAFTVISQDELLTLAQRVQLIQELAQAAGPTGMIAGQILDMEAEKRQISLTQLQQVHALKTGRLIEFAIVAGAIIGFADEVVLSKLRRFAAHLGLAFQIKDDILDVKGERLIIGKPVGSDVANEKSTYVSLLSLTEAEKRLESEIEQAIYLLRELPFNTDLLQWLATHVKNRSH